MSWSTSTKSLLAATVAVTLSAAAFARGNESRARVLHASRDAPSVDIRVANGGPYLFTNVPFKGVGDYVTVPGTDTFALSLPNVMLDGGTTYTVFAVGARRR